MAQRIDIETLQARTTYVAEGLLTSWPTFLDGTDVHPDAVRGALLEFAKAGLLDVGYLDPDANGIAVEDLRFAATVVGALAGCSLSLATIYAVSTVFAGVFIAQIATAEQKRDLLPGIRNGTRQIVFAMTEPQAGSDAAALRTCARAIGQGFEISGEKVFITGAASADDVLVVARSNGADKRELSLFVVPSTSEGLQVEPLPQLAGGTNGSCRLVLN
jgi:alkylation response protein AidB-like acyl-CoA dehydrogenase